MRRGFSPGRYTGGARNLCHDADHLRDGQIEAARSRRSPSRGARRFFLESLCATSASSRSRTCRSSRASPYLRFEPSWMCARMRPTTRPFRCGEPCAERSRGTADSAAHRRSLEVALEGGVRVPAVAGERRLEKGGEVLGECRGTPLSSLGCRAMPPGLRRSSAAMRTSRPGGSRARSSVGCAPPESVGRLWVRSNRSIHLADSVRPSAPRVAPAGQPGDASATFPPCASVHRAGTSGR
jgi:hypothetical protein